MLDRASTFANPEIVRLLKEQFIPVAIDQAYQRRQKDTEGEFYRKIAGQGPRSNFRGTTQGLYVATASGKFLGYTNNRGSDRVSRMMKDALKKYKPTSTATIEKKTVDKRYNPKPPEGGLVVRVRAKILDGYEPTTNQWRQIFQSAVSRDNLWISKKEHQALVRGEVSLSLQKRIARFHLVDNTRGEPPMWRDAEIQSIEMKLSEGKLTGKVHLKTKNGDRGYVVELLGKVETKADKVVRFDVVALGKFWGEGTYTRGAPKGKFPLAVTFELADGKDIADSVPPQASRGWVEGYVRRND